TRFVESGHNKKRNCVGRMIMPVRFLKRRGRQPRTIEIQNYFGEAKPLVNNLSENIDIVKNIFGEPSDLNIRKFSFGGKKEMAIFFLSALVDRQQIQSLIEKLLITLPKYKEEFEEEEAIKWLKDDTLPVSKVQKIHDFHLLSK